MYIACEYAKTLKPGSKKFLIHISQNTSICVLPLLSNYYRCLWNAFFSLWNSQGDYAINSYITCQKLLTFTFPSMKNVSTKVNLFTRRSSYLARFSNKPSKRLNHGYCLPYLCFLFSKFPQNFLVLTVIKISRVLLCFRSNSLLGVLKTSAKLLGKVICRSLFLIKL